MVDIMVKEEDAHWINRIVEYFWFASVTGSSQIKTEIQRSKEEKYKEKHPLSLVKIEKSLSPSLHPGSKETPQRVLYKPVFQKSFPYGGS